MPKPFPVLDAPPVVEVVLGVQFSPLVKFTSGHAGWFWKSYLDSNWTTCADAPPLADQFERFEGVRRGPPKGVMLRLEPASACPRLQITNAADDRMLQLQPTRFHFNWRQRGRSYPSYGTVVAEFEAHFEAFRRFATESGLGPVLLNQWELTYVDRIPQGELWQTPADWHRVFPGLFATIPPVAGIEPERFVGEWGFEITPRRGRLHISASRVDHEGTALALLVETTARGPLARDAGATELRAGLDLGHETVLEAFFRLTSAEAHRAWGMKT
jgi:uncharacterized protein (TIGR04255 family)